MRHRRPTAANDGLTEEHWRAFFMAHSALNGRLCEVSPQKQRVGLEYDIDYDLELAELDGGEEDDPSAAAYAVEGGGLVSQSSLANCGGLISLPADNVRLVCDPQLKPGILSFETRNIHRGVVVVRGKATLKPYASPICN